MKLVLIGLTVEILLGLVGQTLWVVYFWNSPLFIYHHVVALLGVLFAGTCFIIALVKKH